MESVAFIFDQSLMRYDFGSDHPFKIWRVSLAKDILSERGVFLPLEPAREATFDEAALFHTADYLGQVRRFSELGEGLLDGGDTPAFPGCYEASLAIVGGTLRAVELVLSGKYAHAANFAGGLHHAGRGNASGFCIMNDCAVAISSLRKRLKKVAYVDLDAHHGDGVMYGFYDDPGVINVDFHQDGRTLFPGTGSYLETGTGEAKGTKLNIPLPPGSSDDVLVSLIEEIAVPFLEKWMPEFIIVQCGADGLKGDPLANLSYSCAGYLSAIEALHNLSHKICGGRLVLLGGGGYIPDAAAACWAEEYLAVSGASPKRDQPLSKSLPSVLKRVDLLKAAILESSGLGH